MPLINPSVGVGSLLGALGIMVTNPSAAPSGYANTGYTATSKTMPAYTPNTQGTAYTGGLLDLTQALRLPDGNALRVAVENLRVLAEGTAQQVNALKSDLKDIGIISS